SEPVTISAINPTSINFTPNTTVAHSTTTQVIVADLSHNVVVRSSGTDTTANTAFLTNLVANATSFSASYGEFAYIGANAANKYGVYFDVNNSGSISSSSVHHGFVG